MNQSTATGTAPAGMRWFAYAAALWAFLFAALSFYWGQGRPRRRSHPWPGAYGRGC